MPDATRQYPIGKFIPQPRYLPEEIISLIQTIEVFPEKLEILFNQLSADKADMPYRPDGWTARQLFHHLADSHMHAYIRFKWTLTEDTPIIKAYNEKAWAITSEIQHDPLISINLIKALHLKWTILLRHLTDEELKKSFIHPETNQQIPLERMIALYAWHGEHHLAHLKLILDS